MQNENLQKAAERLADRDLAHYQGPHGDDTDIRAGIALARAYLAEHPADDAAVADIDWLNELRREGGDMSWLRVRLCDDGLHLMSPCNLPTEGIDGLRDYVAPNVATRGAVRRLAACLGIALQEKHDAE